MVKLWSPGKCSNTAAHQKASPAVACRTGKPPKGRPSLLETPQENQQAISFTTCSRTLSFSGGGRGREGERERRLPGSAAVSHSWDNFLCGLWLWLLALATLQHSQWWLLTHIILIIWSKTIEPLSNSTATMNEAELKLHGQKNFTRSFWGTICEVKKL